MRRTTTHVVMAALLSAAALSTALATTSPASAAPSLRSQDRWVTGAPIKFYNSGHVRIRRLWDHWNNCVHGDGTQFQDLEVHAGEDTLRLGVTTVSDGECWTQRAKMHWEVAVLNAHGKPTGATADIGLVQGGPTHFLDYTWECNKTTGSMTCKNNNIIGTDVGLGWTP